MLVRSLFSLAGGVLCLYLVAIPVFAQNNADVAELKQIIEAQQKQLDAQRQLLQEVQVQTKSRLEAAGKEVDRLGRLVKEQQQQLASLQKQVNQPPEVGFPSRQPMPVMPLAADTKTTARAPVAKEKVVTSGGGEQVKLAISGHVNRMMNIADDGRSTKAYFVDNDNSESQVRFVGTANPSEELTLGAAIELSIAPNKSGNVDQRNEETNNIFDQRKTEITLESQRYGKLWFGKGNTGSYQAGAVDLSRTTAISYSTIVDTAGGLFFRERDGGELTDVRIGNAFNSFDGLNRRNRIRYDTPRFGGFHLRATAVSDQRYDGSLWWGGQGYGFKAAGAVAIADPNEDDADLQYNGSFSALHEHTGLNLTLSFGLLDRNDQSDQQNFFGKLGWRRDLFAIGETAFSIDYTRSRNLPTDSDDSYSIAAAAVQQIDRYGAELFALYRFHSLDRDVEPKVEDISVVSIGTRVKF
jgi:predicted porin